MSPDTVDFWLECLVEHGYGSYQHTHAELLAAHDELVASAKDRVTVLHLGAPLPEEARRLYRELTGSTTPLGEDDTELLAELAGYCLDDPQPERIPVRENRAVVNAVRLAAGRSLLHVDTVTDVLRLACRASGGDVALREPTRFRSFPRAQRRALLAALDAVVTADTGKLGDVAGRAGPWKRLGSGCTRTSTRSRAPREVFAVARGERRARSVRARAEVAFAARRPVEAAQVLTAAPGMLLRSLDRILRAPEVGAEPGEVDAVLDVRAAPCRDGCCARCASTCSTGPFPTRSGCSSGAPSGPGSPPTPGRRSPTGSWPGPPR